MKLNTAAALVGIALFSVTMAGCGEKNASEVVKESEEAEAEGKGENKADEEETSGEQAASEEQEAAEPVEEKIVGILFPEENEQWKFDAGVMTQALEAAGYTPRVEYAQSDVGLQAGQIEAFLDINVQETVSDEEEKDPEAENDTGEETEDADEKAKSILADSIFVQEEPEVIETLKALVIAPADTYGLEEIVSRAAEEKIPVFSYDELIMDTAGVKYYTTFDKRRIGQMLGEAIADAKDLQKLREEKQSCTIEFLMGSQDDPGALFLYNGLMEVLQEYLDDGTLVCRSQETSFDDTGILRWSGDSAGARLEELLETYYSDTEAPDILCTGFDGAAIAARSVLEDAGLVPNSEQWPLITGVGCKAEAVKDIAEGRIFCSVFMDRRILAEKCADMVDVLLKGEEAPEVNDYEQYDNGVKIIGTFICDAQIIDMDNYELLIDNGYYSADQVEPEMTSVPENGEVQVETEAAQITKAPVETKAPDKLIQKAD